MSRADIGGEEEGMLFGRNLISKSTEGTMDMTYGDRDTN